MALNKNAIQNDVRNMISFWVFGLCNSFLLTVMLSAAQDILSKQRRTTQSVKNVTDICVEEITFRMCSPTSVGVVLICTTIPGLVVKVLSPFFIHRVPYQFRHSMVYILQIISLLVTAFADSAAPALVGVSIASISTGLGEVTYLGLAGHYSKHTISTWSSGTGMAGLFGAFSYAGMTDARLLALTSSQAMLTMNIMPVILALTYHFVLVQASTIRQVSILRPSEWFSASGLEMKESPSDNNNANVKNVYSKWNYRAAEGYSELTSIHDAFNTGVLR
ncbi:hypothetical protein KIN20_012804 [Parelaphostrongylus tenuis]|uniref:Battenin n=1 Tax=Parelaphostrongylus tenuis TaxID=148309 RepID=A0AAD5MB94_PARTN|nr:hypothetical protein KIN20_012804 [Parelaphostrongylus tenuis]